jgi:hypothetical protein
MSSLSLAKVDLVVLARCDVFRRDRGVGHDGLACGLAGAAFTTGKPIEP